MPWRFPLATVLLSLALPAQDGLGYASFMHLDGNPGNALAVAPDLLVERLLVDVQDVAAEMRESRRRLLDDATVLRDPRRQAVRAEVESLPRAHRRDLLRMLDPVACCEVWPRSPTNEQLARDWFLQRRARLPVTDLQLRIDRFAGAVWGGTAGEAPFLDAPEARARFLAGLALGNAEGVVPRLLQAIDNGVPELGDADARRAACLDVVEHWQPERTRNAFRGGAQVTAYSGASVYVVGAPDEWRRLAEACQLWLAALGPLQLPGARFPDPRIDTATRLQALCVTLAERAGAPTRSPLAPAAADELGKLLGLRDTLPVLVTPDGRPRVIAAGRSFRFEGRTVVAFVFESLR